MKTVSSGVCAAKVFTANGLHCGVRKNHYKKDLARIFSEVLFIVILAHAAVKAVCRKALCRTHAA